MPSAPLAGASSAGYQSVADDASLDDIERGAATATAAAATSAALQKERPMLQRQQSSRDGKRRHRVFGHTSHFWAESDDDHDDDDSGAFGGGSVAAGDLSREIRFGFIRKVYGLLSLQFALTVAVASACMLHAPLRNWILANSATAYYGSVLPAFLCLLVLMRCKDTYPTNVQCLTFFTAAQAFSIGVVCALYYAAGYGAVILEAAALTTVVFGALSLFACQTKIDFTVYSGLLYSLLVSLVVWGIFCSLFGFSTNGLYSWLGTLVFCGYVVIDTQMIMNKFGVDDYIIAAIELYLDILNLFLYILSILSESNSYSYND